MSAAGNRVSWRVAALLFCSAALWAGGSDTRRGVAAGSVGDAGGLNLAQAIQIALENNHDLLVAQKEAAQAAEGVGRARALFLPQIAVAAAYDRRDREQEVGFGPQTVGIGEKEFWRAELNARMTVWDFGRTLGVYRSAVAGRKAAEAALQRVRQDVIFEVWRAYFGVLSSRRQVAVAEAAVNSAEAHRNDARVLFRNGVVTESDVLRAEANLSEQRQRLVEARNMCRLAELEFNRVLGRDIGVPVRVREPAMSLPPVYSGGVTGALQAAAENRPEFRQIAEVIAAARGKRTAARGEFLPRVYVAGNVAYLDDDYQVHKTTALGEVGLQYDLFAGGRHLAELRIAGLEVDKAVVQADRVADAVSLQVRSALLEVEAAAARLAAASNTLDFAEANRARVNARYREGAASSTDVVDAESLWVRAQGAFWQAHYDRWVAYGRLLYALGTIEEITKQEEAR